MIAERQFHGYNIPLSGGEPRQAVWKPPEMPEMPRDEGEARQPWVDKWAFDRRGKHVTVAVELYAGGEYRTIDARTFIETLHELPAGAEFKISVAVHEIGATP